jgi:hypothetical protein
MPDGQYHNEAGPAIRSWHENGLPEYESYFLNGKRHNAAGPAVWWLQKNGQRRCESYFLNDRQLNYQALLRECSEGKNSGHAN